MKETALDEIDIKILQHLQSDARIPNVRLADRVGLSPAPCLRRVRALEKAGMIRSYVAVLNPASIGLNVTVLVQVTLDRRVAERTTLFEDAVRARSEVIGCYAITGPADFLLVLVLDDLDAFEELRESFLSRLECVASTNSSFVLRQVKSVTEFPLSSARRTEAGAGEAAGEPRGLEPRVALRR